MSLGNCFIKPQVQGILGIHLVSGRLSYKVVSALLYCSTMFVLLVGWGGAGLFSSSSSAFAQCIHKHNAFGMTLKSQQMVLAPAELLLVAKVLLSCLGKSRRVQ